MAANAPKKNNTMVIVFLVIFVGIIGLAGVGALAFVLRQPAILGKLMGKQTKLAIREAEAKAPEQPDIPPIEPPQVPNPATSAPDTATTDEPAVEEPPVEVQEPVNAEPVPAEETKPEETKPADPAPAEKKPEEKKPEEKKPEEKKPVEKKPAEKRPADSTKGLATGPRSYYVHTGKCLTPTEASDLQSTLNGKWSGWGLKQDSSKGLNFNKWKVGPREGADPKSFNNEDFCYEIRTGSITKKQAEFLQGKLKGLGYAAGVGKEA